MCFAPALLPAHRQRQVITLSLVKACSIAQSSWSKLSHVSSLWRQIPPVKEPVLGRLFLVRHGETTWNSTRRYQGHTDVPLSDTGWAQAGRLRQRLAGQRIDLAYASDLSRAAETARILLADRDDVPIEYRNDLREIAYGQWEGQTHAEILASHPEQMKHWGENPWAYFPPDGEPFGAFTDRIHTFLDEVVLPRREANMLIVAHGGPIRTMLCYLLGMAPNPWRIWLEPASLSIVELNPASTVLALLNETCHLAEAVPIEGA